MDAFFGVLGFLASAVSIVITVLTSIGYYTIAKNRGYDKPWFAWIPILGDYLKGAIADSINEDNDSRSIYRILCPAVIVLQQVISLWSAFNTFMYLIGELSGKGGMAANIQGSNTLLFVVGIAGTVVNLLAFHRLAADYEPDREIIYTVIALLCGVPGIFVFMMRNNTSMGQMRRQQVENRVKEVYVENVSGYGKPQNK